MKPMVAHPRRVRRFLLGGVLILMACAALAFFFLSSAIVAIEGGFIPRQVYSISSPDGRTLLTVSKRVAFPASELIDPTIIVTFKLREIDNGRLLDRINLTMLEDSDLREPELEWTPDAVHVGNLDDRNSRRITLSRSSEPH